MIEHPSQKIENLKIDIKIDTKIEGLYEKLYEKSCDSKVEKNIYEMDHSQLVDLLDSKFNQFEQKVEGLLREPKFSNNMEIYDLSPRTSSTSTSTIPASTSSSSASTCSTKPQKKKPMF